MVDTTGIVVVGGGVVGASVAYHLSKMGRADVTVLEKEPAPMTGSTAMCAGGIRAQFATVVNIALSLASIAQFERMEEDLGLPIDFHQAGYLWLLSTPDQARSFGCKAMVQRRAGVHVDGLTPAEVANRWPHIRTDDLTGAVFSPRDGYADPHAVGHAFLSRAREAGVRILCDTRVTGVNVSGGRVRGVETTGGPMACEWVVNAAGPRAKEVAGLAGIALPVDPVRRCLWVTERFDGVPDRSPLTIDVGTGLYFRKESGAVMMGMSNPAEPPSFDTSVDWAFFEGSVLGAAVHRVPALADTAVRKGWAGLYEVTPDHHAVLGRVPGVEGFLCANGFSGHGFMQSPAAGRLIAEEVVFGAAKTLDISPLSITRFARGPLIDEENVV